MKPALPILAGLLLAAAPAAAASTNINLAFENAHDADLAAGLDLIRAGKAAEAVAAMDRIIAAYERAYPAGMNFCAKYEAEGVMVGILAAAEVDKAPAPADGKPITITVLGPGWCTALWTKGFALIDLNQSPLAEAALAKAVAMAPTDAHYVNEYAELFKARRDWQRPYDLFAMAWERVDRDRKGPDARVAARALRGMGYTKIELGDLKAAKRLFRQSQEYEPASEAARRELEYIDRKAATGS